MSATWIRFDERTDVLGSLREVKRSLSAANQGDELAWKWVVLAAHNALQGAMVCFLTGSAKLGALKKKHAKDWLEWLENRPEEGNPPSEWLESPPGLLERIGNLSLRLERAGTELSITENETISFGKLNSLRAELTHFKPSGWLIDLKSIRSVLSDVFGLLDRICADPYPFRHMQDPQRDELRRLIAECRRAIA